MAHVIGETDARWEQGKKSWSTGDIIHSSDQLHLADGLVEIEFTSGARATIEGPALLIPHQEKVELKFGSLFAIAPKSTQDFVVVTPSTRIIDLGTRFGVIVSKTGITEVHVVEGRVETSLLDSFGSVIESRMLTASDAIRVQPRSNNISDIDIRPENFVQNIIEYETEPVLVAHWKMNEGAGASIAKDSSQNQLDLRIIPEVGISPFTDTEGPSGLLLAAGPFSKQVQQLQRVLTKAEAGKFDVTKFTIELWARNPSLLGNRKSSNLLFHYRNTVIHKASQVNLYTNNTNGYLAIGYLTTNGSYVAHNFSKKLSWDKNRWYHIVLTYDANTPAPNDSIITITRTPEQEIIPDSSKTFSNVEDIVPFVANGNLIIGGSSHQEIPRKWGGDIDDVKFFNGIPKKYLSTKLKGRQ